MQGKVKMFNKEKGYGFIKLSDGRDVFFHYSQLGDGRLQDDRGKRRGGIRSGRGRPGYQAYNVKKL